ncbi:MAG: hypothetical protein HYZ65_14470, partial [Burkholderiales bacterium]|nr:hypothetical protein [Burkholderiales bacterium]
MQNIRPYALTSQRSLALLIALGLHLLLLQLLNGKACRREVEPAPTFTSLMLLAAPALAPAPLAATPRPARAGGARQITLAAPAAEPSPDQASAADLSAALEQDRPHHSSTTLKLDLKDAVAMIATAERRRRAQPPL